MSGRIGLAKTAGMVWVAPVGAPSLPMIETVGREAIVNVGDLDLEGKAEVSKLRDVTGDFVVVGGVPLSVGVGRWVMSWKLKGNFPPRASR
jgi:hypothetical protein